MSSLTIGIPTYNFADGIIENRKRLIALLNNKVKLLISDDCSIDGSYDKLEIAFKDCEGVRVKKNISNLGLHGNLHSLFKECDTDYLFLLSDEDFVIEENVELLLNFVSKYKPAFCSGGFVKNQGRKDDFVYRGQKSNAIILPEHFHSSSFYISGLVYNVGASRLYVDDIYEKAKINDVCAIYYQSILALNLIFHHECRWFEAPVARQVFYGEPRVKHGSKKYNIVEARWAQFKGFVEYIEDFCKDSNELHVIERKEKLLHHFKSTFIHWLQWGVACEMPDLFEYMPEGLQDILVGFDKLVPKEVSKATKSTWLLTRAYC